MASRALIEAIIEQWIARRLYGSRGYPEAILPYVDLLFLLVRRCAVTETAVAIGEPTLFT